MTTDFFILATKTSAFAILLRRWATQNRATARQAPALREFNRGLHGKISHEFTRIYTNYLLTEDFTDCTDYTEKLATDSFDTSTSSAQASSGRGNTDLPC